MIEFRTVICAAGKFSSAILRLMAFVETLAASFLDSNQLFTLTDRHCCALNRVVRSVAVEAGDDFLRRRRCSIGRWFTEGFFPAACFTDVVNSAAVACILLW